MLAEHLHDPPGGWTIGGRRREYLDADVLSFACRHAIGIRHQYFVLDPRILGNHVIHAARAAHAPDHMRGVALQHFDNGCLAAPAMILAGSTRQNLVTMKDLAHLAAVKVQILASFGGNQEAVTLAVRLHRAPHQVHARDRAISATAVAHQLPVALHRPQAPAQRFARLLVEQIETRGDLVDGQRDACFRQDLQNVFAARDGVRVALGLARKLRIALARSDRLFPRYQRISPCCGLAA